ncbi:hypothetical protein VC83_08258, partial [Pseudogymnoascus destructans]
MDIYNFDKTGFIIGVILKGAPVAMVGGGFNAFNQPEGDAGITPSPGSPVLGSE